MTDPLESLIAYCTDAERVCPHRWTELWEMLLDRHRKGAGWDPSLPLTLSMWWDTFGSGLLIGAGLYQVTPIKRTCLKHRQSPAHFLSEHWRAGISGAFRMGLEHGAFCLGCCWVLMGFLFVGGVMNLLWIAAIATFVFAEKVLPLPDSPIPTRLTGGAMILGGLVLLGTWAMGGG